MLRLSVRSIACSLVLAAALTLVPRGPALADEGSGLRAWGPTVGMNLDPDQITAGLMADFGTLAAPIGLLGFMDIGFGDDVTSIIVAPSAVVKFALGEVGRFYGGLSLGLAYYNFDVPKGHQAAADRLGIEIDDSSTDFVAAFDFGYVYPLRSSDNGIVFDFRLGLVDEHPDFKATLGYALGLLD